MEKTIKEITRAGKKHAYDKKKMEKK